MLMRASFALALVWFIIPHEPDLGLGRPSLRPPIAAVEGSLRKYAATRCAVLMSGGDKRYITVQRP